MKEKVSLHITTLVGSTEGVALIQALESCGIHDDIQIVRKGINIPIASLKQLSNVNIHLEALRLHTRKTDKYEYRTYPVTLYEHGRALINLQKIKYNFCTYLLDILFWL